MCRDFSFFSNQIHSLKHLTQCLVNRTKNASAILQVFFFFSFNHPERKNHRSRSKTDDVTPRGRPRSRCDFKSDFQKTPEKNGKFFKPQNHGVRILPGRPVCGFYDRLERRPRRWNRRSWRWFFFRRTVIRAPRGPAPHAHNTRGQRVASVPARRTRDCWLGRSTVANDGIPIRSFRKRTYVRVRSVLFVVGSTWRKRHDHV